MTHKQVLFFIIISLFIIFSFPTTSRADIATVKDWVGVFPIFAKGIRSNTVPFPSPTPAGFPDGHAWAYTSSCTQTPGLYAKTANPIGCNFTLPYPMTGEFVFRLYANDGNDDTGDALVDTSDKFNLYVTATPIPVSPAGKLSRITGDLTLDSDIQVNKTGVIFVDGNLYIKQNLEAKPNPNDDTITAKNGLVFIVKGSIYINRSVEKINAFLISHGKNAAGADTIPFCSAWDGIIPPNPNPNGSNCVDDPVAGNQKDLTINGSVISLNTTLPPKFVRQKNVPVNEPAEIINYQPKYMIIMKDIFSRDLKIWKEVQ